LCVGEHVGLHRYQELAPKTVPVVVAAVEGRFSWRDRRPGVPICFRWKQIRGSIILNL
jgi:hypothetical protein